MASDTAIPFSPPRKCLLPLPGRTLAVWVSDLGHWLMEVTVRGWEGWKCCVVMLMLKVIDSSLYQLISVSSSRYSDALLDGQAFYKALIIYPDNVKLLLSGQQCICDAKFRFSIAEHAWHRFELHLNVCRSWVAASAQRLIFIIVAIRRQMHICQHRLLFVFCMWQRTTVSCN